MEQSKQHPGNAQTRGHGLWHTRRPAHSAATAPGMGQQGPLVLADSVAGSDAEAIAGPAVATAGGPESAAPCCTLPGGRLVLQRFVDLARASLATPHHATSRLRCPARRSLALPANG